MLEQFKSFVIRSLTLNIASAVREMGVFSVPVFIFECNLSEVIVMVLGINYHVLIKSTLLGIRKPFKMVRYCNLHRGFYFGVITFFRDFFVKITKGNRDIPDWLS